MLETVTVEEIPLGLPSGMATGTLLLKRTGSPGAPALRRKLRTRVSWSDLTKKEKSMGEPQIKLGEVLILNGVRLAAILDRDTSMPISSYPPVNQRPDIS